MAKKISESLKIQRSRETRLWIGTVLGILSTAAAVFTAGCTFFKGGRK